MSWKEEFSEFIHFLDKSTVTFPNRIFSSIPEKNSTPVRKIIFVLENMIEQLRKRLVPSTQALAQALVYKFNGPHRRQGYWMNYKNLSRALRRYNEDDLLQKVFDIYKKATATGVGFYMPSSEVVVYLGSAYLKRLFQLKQIRDLCIRTAHVIMGQLELGHWEKFSLFIVALCADINKGIAKQAKDMESVYDGISAFLTSLDESVKEADEPVKFESASKCQKVLKTYFFAPGLCRFPSSLSDLSLFDDLRGPSTGQNNLDTARVMQLLQLSDDQLEIVRTKDLMARLKDEILSSMDSNDDKVDLGMVVERVDEGGTKSENAELRKTSSVDCVLSIECESSISLNIPETFREASEKKHLAVDNKRKQMKKKLRKRSKLILHDSNETTSSSLFWNPNSHSDEISNVENPLNKKTRKDKRSSEQADNLSYIPYTSTPHSKKKGKSKKIHKRHEIGSGAVDGMVSMRRKSMECIMDVSISAVPLKKKKKQHSLNA